MKRLLLGLILASAAAHAGAQTVFKWTMPDGSVRFSDRPQEEGAVAGEEIEIVGAPAAADGGGAVRASDPVDPDREQPPEPEKFAGYDKFSIAAPTPDEAIRDNGGNITVRLALEPSLQPRHLIEVFMDGRSLGTGRTTSITMTNVDRGSHTVQASIRDQSGVRVVTTGAVTFNLLRVAAGS